MARITKRSLFTNKIRTLDIPQYTQEEFDNRYNAYLKQGKLIQDVFPDLSVSAREFIMTGITDEEWDEFMSDADTKQEKASGRLNDWYE